MRWLIDVRSKLSRWHWSTELRRKLVLMVLVGPSDRSIAYLVEAS